MGLIILIVLPIHLIHLLLMILMWWMMLKIWETHSVNLLINISSDRSKGLTLSHLPLIWIRLAVQTTLGQIQYRDLVEDLGCKCSTTTKEVPSLLSMIQFQCPLQLRALASHLLRLRTRLVQTESACPHLPPVKKLRILIFSLLRSKLFSLVTILLCSILRLSSLRIMSPLKPVKRNVALSSHMQLILIKE